MPATPTTPATPEATTYRPNIYTSNSKSFKVQNSMYSQNTIPSPADSHSDSPGETHLEYKDPERSFQRPTVPTPAPEEYSDAERDISSIRSAYNRIATTPRSSKKRYLCDFEGCSNPTFDRKCEYTKHMDKHTRPYKCSYPSCAKLQGFTYSGGLIRHEREVHNRYGGPKRPLMCPHTDCKRSTGNGFSRRENLKEHLRRVHRGSGDVDVDAVTDGSPNVKIKPNGRKHDGEQDVEASSPTHSREGQWINVKGSSAKRKRLDSVPITEEDYENDSDASSETDVRGEIKRLKAEVARQNGVISDQGEMLSILHRQVQALISSRLPQG